MSDDAAAFRRIPLELFNQGNMKLVDELFTEDYVEHVSIPGFPDGRDAVRTLVPMLRAAFPDLEYSLISQLQDGEMHCGHVSVKGTMQGDFMGMPATGKTATWEEIHIARIRDGRLVEHWAVQDQLRMLQELGLAPAPPAG
jgi:predicted ester cyclase